MSSSSSKSGGGKVRASHILIKNQGSRGPASWNDPEGRIIKNTTRETAVSQLNNIRNDIVSGKANFEDVASRFFECSSAKRGGDLSMVYCGMVQKDEVGISIRGRHFYMTSRCGICMQSVKSGQGIAIFTAECSHTFHFPCIVKKHPMVTFPVCNTSWKEIPVLSIKTDNNNNKRNLKVYNDDEPLMSPTSLSHFNPIPESENEQDEEDNINTEFQGFNVNPLPNLPITRNLQISLLTGGRHCCRQQKLRDLRCRFEAEASARAETNASRSD